MTTTQQQAKAAAERLMKERGCLVVGFPAAWDFKTQTYVVPAVERGTRLLDFAGTEIPGKALEVTANATHGDWETQAKHLGYKSDIPRNKSHRFFFARLVDAQKAEGGK